MLERIQGVWIGYVGEEKDRGVLEKKNRNSTTKRIYRYRLWGLRIKATSDPGNRLEEVGEKS